MQPDDDSRSSVRSRGPELAVAALLFAIAMLVIVDALRVGAGWADDGPRSGYFPFRIGLLLAGASGWVFVRQALAWRRDTAAFAERSQLVDVLAMLLPMAVYVAGIWAVGLYVSSALLIGWFMKRYGRYGWAATAAVSIGVPLLVFFVFERWFLVLLPKGPLERLVGL